MATDLRERLLDAAGDPGHALDLTSVDRRAHRLTVRRRAGRASAVTLAVVLALGGALLFTGRGADDGTMHIATPRPSTTTPAEVFDSQGDRVQLPSGWYRAGSPLVPYLLWPKEILSAATFPLAPDDQGSRCDGGLPKGTLDAMQPTDAFVWIVDWAPSPQLPAGVADKLDPSTFPQRPTHFALDQFESLDCTGAASDSGTTSRHVYFSEHGRLIEAHITLGDQVTAERIAQVLSLLDSLQLAPADETSHLTPTTPATTNEPSPTTAPSSSRPAESMCALQRDPADFYTLAQPVTITLPNGRTIPIVPGNPIATPESVTLDSDGLMPGSPGSAAAQLWGAATEGGPFAGLQNASPGDIVVLRQLAPAECEQRWRITQVTTTQDMLTPNRPVLRLIGFTPNASGPVTQFYVEAVPA